MNPFATETIIRNRWTPVPDGHGNLVRPAQPSPLTITRCQVDPATSNESLTGGDSVASRWTVFAPPHADVTAYDTVVYSGLEYEVDGAPQDHDDPLDVLSHTVIQLKRVDG